MKKILLILLLLAIGAAGWYAVKQHQNDQNDQVAGPSSAQTSTTSTNKYLVIKEWGVQFKLTDVTKDATYKLASPADDNVTISTPRMDEISQTYSECSGANNSLALARAKPGDDHFGSPWTEKELAKISKQIGGYYYYPSSGQACFPEDGGDFTRSDLKDEVGRIRANLTPVLSSIEAIE